MNKNDKADIHSGIAWAITFALAAIIMSIIAIATRYPRTDLSMDYMVFIVVLLIICIVALAWQSCRHSERLKKHDRCARLFARRVVNHNISQNNDNKNLALHNIETDVDEILHEAKGFVKFCKYACWVIIPFCLITSIAHCVVLFPRIINQKSAEEGQSGYAHLGIDYLGLIVAIFAIIVTLLVTWQIYSTIKAKEELKDFTDQFDERLKSVEICCREGRAAIKQIRKDFKDSEKRLISKISSEVCHAVIGFESIKKADYKHIIKVLFNNYENSFSDSLKHLALQQLAIMFSANADRVNYDDLIEAVIKAVDKEQVNNLAKDLFDGDKLRDDTIEISNVGKTIELFNHLLKSYPKESK